MIHPSVLLAEPGTFQGKDVLIRVFLFILVAAIFFIAGYAGQVNGRAKGWVKYISLAPLIGCIFFGKPYFDYANNSFTNAAGQIGGNSKLAYNLAFVLPAILIPLVIVICVVVDKRMKAANAEY